MRANKRSQRNQPIFVDWSLAALDEERMIRIRSVAGQSQKVSSIRLCQELELEWNPLRMRIIHPLIQLLFIIIRQTWLPQLLFFVHFFRSFVAVFSVASWLVDDCSCPVIQSQDNYADCPQPSDPLLDCFRFKIKDCRRRVVGRWFQSSGAARDLTKDSKTEFVNVNEGTIQSKRWVKLLCLT